MIDWLTKMVKTMKLVIILMNCGKEEETDSNPSEQCLEEEQ